MDHDQLATISWETGVISRVSRSQVPPLSDTLQRYLKAVEPILTPKEFAETKAVVDEVGAQVGTKDQNAIPPVERFVASMRSLTVAQCTVVYKSK